jgi:hypothetical protein
MNTNKLRRSVLSLALAVTAIAVVACNTPTEVKPPTATPAPSPAASSSPAASPVGSPVASPGAVSKVDSLVGKWPGKEGTYLNITKKGDKYSIEIADLDGPKSFEGTAKGDTIEFTRNGKTEVIKASTGAETGMKGFEKETNCVVVTKGTEGFCKK